MTTISEGPRSVADAIADLDIRAQAFVDGGYVDAASGETFDCISPISGEIVARVAACDTADVDRAVAGARAAFESGAWSRLAPKKRKRVLQKLSALMSDHAEELALLETVDMGKPIRDATNVDVPLAIECIAGTARRSTRSTTRSRPPVTTRTSLSCASRSELWAPSCRGTSPS